MTNKEYIEKNNISFSEAMKMYDNEKYPCINDWLSQERQEHTFKVGDFVKIIGRIQSRIYHKKLSGDEVELRTAYEVSIGRIIEHESGSEKDFAGELQEDSK